MSARTFKFALVVFSVLCAGAGAASAVAFDNLVPNSRYNVSCHVHSVGDGFPCQTDNATLSYYMDSAGDFELESADRGDVTYALNTFYNPTDLKVVLDTTPTFSGSAETDLVFQEGSSGLNSGSAGTYWCNGTGSGSYQCDQGYVRIIGNGGYTRGRVCHEAGHGIGLLHGAQSDPWLSQEDSRLGCMQTPSSPTDTLSQTSRENINAAY